MVAQIATFVTTIYLHRAKTHGALVLYPDIEWACRFLLWITTGIKPREWVAVHRKHHAFTDKEDDPHSPKIHGFVRVQLGNAFLYAKAKKDQNMVRKYAPEIKGDVWDKRLFNHGLSGVLLGTVILCLVFGLWLGLLAAITHAVLYVFVLSSSINGLCHWRGYRNFDNTATNIHTIAWVTAGEGFHNNHHRYPNSPKFSCRKYEFDPAWPVIRLLMMLGLAWPSKK